jgi:hypothetical protein
VLFKGPFTAFAKRKGLEKGKHREWFNYSPKIELFKIEFDSCSSSENIGTGSVTHLLFFRAKKLEKQALSIQQSRR